MYPIDYRIIESYRLDQERWLRQQENLRLAMEAYKARRARQPGQGMAQRVMHWLNML
jgi:hypothetical protein